MHPSAATSRSRVAGSTSIPVTYGSPGAHGVRPTTRVAANGGGPHATEEFVRDAVDRGPVRFRPHDLVDALRMFATQVDCSDETAVAHERRHVRAQPATSSACTFQRAAQFDATAQLGCSATRSADAEMRGAKCVSFLFA